LLAILKWLKARESLEDAQKMRVSLHAQIEELASRGPFRPQFTATHSEILDAVIEGTDADMGNIQIYDPQTRSLHIRVHRGFHEPFLEFFNSVDPGHAACGTALQSRERVIVPDVSDSTVFSGTHLWEVMLDAGVRAVQSTSFIGKLGHIWGMLSTHYRTVTSLPRRTCALSTISLLGPPTSSRPSTALRIPMAVLWPRTAMIPKPWRQPPCRRRIRLLPVRGKTRIAQ
jgi:hypothetical protein